MKFITFIFKSFVFLFLLWTVILFTTPYGYQVRVTLAEMILSSQHQYLAKYTFLPQSELNSLLKNIEDPAYINSVKINDSKNSGSFMDAGNTVNTAESSFPNFKNQKLVVKIDDLEKDYGPTYFYKGKIIEISNPLNVKLIGSKLVDHGEQIFTIAKRAHALVASNASGFIDRNGVGNGGTATGIVIENGEVKNSNPDEKTYVAGITNKGLFVTGFYSANDLLNLNVKYAAGFKPQLIVNGQKMVSGDGGWGIGPRTAIGQKADGTIVIVEIDGRQPSRSIGTTLTEVQDIMYDRGVVNAMAMDGGSSSSIYFNRKNVTTPSSVGHVPRYLPNIWAVIPKTGQQLEVYENGVKVPKSELHY